MQLNLANIFETERFLDKEGDFAIENAIEECVWHIENSVGLYFEKHEMRHQIDALFYHMLLSEIRRQEQKEK